MGGPSFDRLTDRERAILRLIPDCRNSSEIGRLTGDSPTTVDKLIKSARLKLDAPDRWGAARLFLAYETAGPVLGPPTQDLPKSQTSGFPLPIPTAGRPTNDLTIRQRLVAIVALAIVIALTAVAVLAVSGTVERALAPLADKLGELLK